MIKYKYQILPARPIDIHFPCDVELHNRAYMYWRDFWKDIFAQTGHADHLNRDHFIRQDKIAVITAGDDIVGMHLYGFHRFDANACRDNPFFDDLDETSRLRLRQDGLVYGMCMEYLTVNPQYRKSKTGIPFGEILIGLGLEIMKQNGLDCVFGTAREDVKVDQMAALFGGRAYSSSIKKYDYPCCLMVIADSVRHLHPNLAQRELIKNLWDHRIDQTLKFQNPILRRNSWTEKSA